MQVKFKQNGGIYFMWLLLSVLAIEVWKDLDLIEGRCYLYNVPKFPNFSFFLILK